MKLFNEAIEYFNNNTERLQVQRDIDAGEFVMPSRKRIYDRAAREQVERLSARRKAEDFFSSGKTYLGRVFAASGFRKTRGTPRSQLDWALIQVSKDRVSDNIVSP